MLASSVQTATSIAMDRSRIETHIKPLLGPRLVSNLTLRDVEAMQADIAAGKSARGKKAQGCGGRSTGGAGVAARAISTFRALLGHAARLGLIEKNPASGVRQMASRKVKRRLLDRVCAKAKLSGVTPHVLRHTFASIAGDLGFSELTIAGLLGHSSRGVTQR
jgi:integrase